MWRGGRPLPGPVHGGAAGIPCPSPSHRLNREDAGRGAERQSRELEGPGARNDPRAPTPGRGALSGRSLRIRGVRPNHRHVPVYVTCPPARGRPAPAARLRVPGVCSCSCSSEPAREPSSPGAVRPCVATGLRLNEALDTSVSASGPCTRGALPALRRKPPRVPILVLTSHALQDAASASVSGKGTSPSSSGGPHIMGLQIMFITCTHMHAHAKCTHTHAHSHMCTHRHAHDTNRDTHVYTPHTCAHTFKHVHTAVHTSHVCMHAHVGSHTHVHTCTCAHIHTHVHAHTYSSCRKPATPRRDRDVAAPVGVGRPDSSVDLSGTMACAPHGPHCGSALCRGVARGRGPGAGLPRQQTAPPRPRRPFPREPACGRGVLLRDGRPAESET